MGSSLERADVTPSRLEVVVHLSAMTSPESRILKSDRVIRLFLDGGWWLKLEISEDRYRVNRG